MKKNNKKSNNKKSNIKKINDKESNTKKLDDSKLKNKKSNSFKFPLWIISLLLPPIGVVLYFIKKKDKKESKSILTSFIIGFCIYSFILLGILNSTPEKTVSEWYNDVQNNETIVTVIGLTTCSHCQELKPVITRLSKKYKFNLYFFEVDTLSTEESDILYNTLDLKDYDEHVPFIFIVKDKEYANGTVGYSTQASLETYLMDNDIYKKD